MGTVYTIPPGVPFLPTLARGVLERVSGASGDPLALASATLLLPTRRSVRAAREVFLTVSDSSALLLPSIRPLGDVDEEGLIIDGLVGGPAGDDLALPPALPNLERELVLTRLILEWGKHDGGAHTPNTPGQAAALAGELASFLDLLETEGVETGALTSLVPEAFAVHWQVTLDFLTILSEVWPKYLKDSGYAGFAARRDGLICALIAKLESEPLEGPIIAAGSTGSIPATADLLSCIAGLDQGAVVLPGLDLHMAEDVWALVGPDHPQYGMKQLIGHMGCTREEVRMWPGAEAGVTNHARVHLIREALRPAEATDGWPEALESLDPDLDAALEGLKIIEASGPQGEAGAIGLILREVLETPGRTGALVTPDRGLARRVCAVLRRWGVDIDDSAGVPLSQSPPGAFMRLMLRFVAEDWAPIPLLELLKHPLAAVGVAPARLRALARLLEVHVLRGPRPAPGPEGLMEAIDAVELEADVRLSLRVLVEGLSEAAAPLEEVMSGGGADLGLAAMVGAHVVAAEALAADGTLSGAERLWAGEAGEGLALFVGELLAGGDDLLRLRGSDYPALFDILLSRRVVRPRQGRHPRLFIWGPLEARLQFADVMVLGGLNEGTWPAEAGIDPWLSRPMRQVLGLPSPERRLGLSAHDFVQGAAVSCVYLTRSRKVDGTPAVPARWLLRLQTVLKAAERAALIDETDRWAYWYGELDTPQVKPQAISAPKPCPPVNQRPRQLSVTQIEHWIRDPYTIFARHILKLRPFDVLDADPGAAERGIIVHDIFHEFVNACPDALPDNALERLMEIGREAFASLDDRPGLTAFWWPRFERMAEWFIHEFESEHRLRASPFSAEERGSFIFDSIGGPFELTARADRIDRIGDGFAIYDYKTGGVPSDKQMRAGLAPQLPLEAVIAAKGGFNGVDGPIIELAHVWLSGGLDGGAFMPTSDDPSELAQAAEVRLKELVAEFDDASRAYPALRRPMFSYRYGDYDHLARVKEWAVGADGEDA